MALRQHFSAPVQITQEDLNPAAPVTGQTQVIEPQVSAVHEAVMAANDKELRQNEEMIDDAGEIVENIADVRNEVAAANEEGGLSAESLLFASIAMEANYRRLGQQVPCELVSVESFPKTGERLVVNLESLDVSLEGFFDSVVELGKRALSAYTRNMTATWTSLNVQLMATKRYLQAAKRAKIPNEGKVKITEWRVSKNKSSVVDNVPKELAATIDMLVEVMEPMTKAAGPAFEANIKAANALNTDSEESFKTSLQHIVSNWKDPRAKYGHTKLVEPLLGGVSLFVDKPKTYYGDMALAKKLDALAHDAYPTTYGFRGDSGRKFGIGYIPAFSTEDINTVGSKCIRAVQALTWWRATMEKLSGVFSDVTMVGKIARRSRGKMIGRGFGGVKNEFSDEIRMLREALATSNRLRFHIGYDAGMDLMFQLRTFNLIAKGSLKLATDKA